MTDFSFPVRVTWPGGKHVVSLVDGKPPLPVATPPEFKGAFPAEWSPEDVLVSAAASCFGVTLIALAERAALPLHTLTVDAVGTVGRREPEPFGFKEIRLRVAATTDPGREDDLRRAAERAEQGCIVSNALAIPVELELDVRAPEGAPA